MRTAVLAVAAIAALALASQRATATTFTITSSANAGAGTLRDAIQACNADPAATADVPDTIVFAVQGDIAPNAALPRIANHVTMIGPDSLTVQIKGAKTFRALEVGAGVTVRLVNLRFTSGTTSDVGAGILNAGTLTLVGCNLRNNTTGTKGGAIQNTGTLTLVDCWLDKNKVKSGSGPNQGGGGINNDDPGTVTLIGCTLSGNTASKGGFGGGIRNASSGAVTLVNCTVAFNESHEPTPGGGGIAAIGSGITKIDNTIVVGEPWGGDLYGTIASDLGHNVIGSTANATLTGNTTGNRVNVAAASVIEPTLEHNLVFGRTHALVSASPALDAADSSVTAGALALQADARGFARRANGAVDIGAFEEQQPLGPELMRNASFETSLAGWKGYRGTAALIAGGLDGASAAHVAARATLDPFGLENPTAVASTARRARYRLSALVRSDSSHAQVQLEVRENHGSTRLQTVISPAVPLGSAWQLVTVDVVAKGSRSSLDLRVIDTPVTPSESFAIDLVSIRTVLGPDTPPRVIAPAFAIAFVGLPLTITVQSFDPDGDTLAVTNGDVSALPATAVFTEAPDHRSGTLTWTPQEEDLGDSPYTVIFSAENVRTGHVVTSIAVREAPANLVANPGFESDSTGWGAYGGDTLSRSNDAHSGAAALRMKSKRKSTSTFGTGDLPNWIARVDGAGARYRFVAWVKSDSGTGLAKLRVRELLGKKQIGATHNSLGVRLSPFWQLVTLDVAAADTGSTLDLRVTDTPRKKGESFLVDDVMILPLGPPAALSAGTAGGIASARPEDPLGDAAPAAMVAAGPRAFVTPAGATLDAPPSTWSLSIEGLDPDDEADLPAVTLRYGGREIAANADLTRLGDDADENGIEEITASFAADDLEALLVGALGGAPAGATSIEALVAVQGAAGEGFEVPVEIAIEAAQPSVFSAHFAPNPFHGAGALAFTMTRPGAVRVTVLDVAGRVVRTPVNEVAAAGLHRVPIRAAERGSVLPSGLYFYRIEAPEGVLRGRFVLSK